MIFLSTPRGNTCSAHQLNVYSSFWEEDESEQGELGTQPSIKGPFDLSAREADFTPRPTATSFPSEVSCDIPSSVELNWHRGESPHAMPPGGPCCGVSAGDILQTTGHAVDSCTGWGAIRPHTPSSCYASSPSCVHTCSHSQPWRETCQTPTPALPTAAALEPFHSAAGSGDLAQGKKLSL